MSRPIRIAYDGALYHVMNRGLNRLKIFHSDQDYQKFLSILKESVKMWDLQIHAVSLMPNHYHLLVETPLANISRAMRHIGAVYTQWVNRQTSRDGPLFRGRFKAILVDEESYLVELLRYIHLNPVKAGLVKDARDHPWTSHLAYLKTLKNWNWLTTDRLLHFFGKDEKLARHELKKFMLTGVPKTLEDRLASKNWPSIFGSKSFEKLIEWNFVKELQSKEIKYAPLRIKKLEIKTLKKIICDTFNCNWDALSSPKDQEHKRLRRLAIALIQRELKLKHADLTLIFPGVIPSTISRSCRHAPDQNPNAWEVLMGNVQNAKSKI